MDQALFLESLVAACFVLLAVVLIGAREVLCAKKNLVVEGKKILRVWMLPCVTSDGDTAARSV